MRAFLPNAAITLLTFASAVESYLAKHGLGFPDGHLTEYERGIQIPLTFLTFVFSCCFLAFLLLTLVRKNFRYRAGLSFAFLGISVSSLLIRCVVLPWYLLSYLRLENGTGG